MNTEAHVLTEPAVGGMAPSGWGLPKRIAFRFAFVYLILFALTDQIFAGFFPMPKLRMPDFATVWPTRSIVFWTAAHIFHISQPSYAGTGSGDRTYDWLLAFCALVIAAVTTLIWSMADRTRSSYTRLYAWFRLFVRFALASEMFLYGTAKLIPIQMPFPYLTKLLEPFGNFSPMGVLWSSVGASPAWESFTGCAEVLAGLFLIFPRTTTFGALICLADTIEIFTLNMTYDVPVKLFSFHLMLMALFLLAPECRRLFVFFFLNNSAPAPRLFPLFDRPRANRLALAVQVGYGILLLGLYLHSAYDGWFKYGGGSPKSPFYGIWNVEQMLIDGKERSPLVSDYDRWRRVIFERPDTMTFQRMDDSFSGFLVKIDAKHRTIALSKRNDRKWRGILAYERPIDDRLLLNGVLGGHPISVRLQRFDRSKFLLISRGFHWIAEAPFNR